MQRERRDFLPSENILAFYFIKYDPNKIPKAKVVCWYLLQFLRNFITCTTYFCLAVCLLCSPEFQELAGRVVELEKVRKETVRYDLRLTKSRFSVIWARMNHFETRLMVLSQKGDS